ncbi:hypothetical protein AB6F64_18845 [Providencia hangzhouensis]|nr:MULTISPECIES: hypothetical protein [Providencia]MBJ9969904.1 hypothetical protein [Providencia rettgeri]MCB6146191.1 hypothetical protein [Providencia rettgeri]MCF8962256.1 hypothetical protein [Providencia rettgeri]TNV02799.1 hypothetical protein FH869_09835 [Providencia rettgeri]UDQ67087.1 hypothetical protein LHK11_18630 [Providencia rettgeri]
MNINFDLNNAKYQRIEQLMQSIENRLKRMTNLEKVIGRNFTEIGNQYWDSRSGISDKVTMGLYRKNSLVKRKVSLHKENFLKMNELIATTKKTIMNDQACFSRDDTTFNTLDMNNIHLYSSPINNWIKVKNDRVVSDDLTNKILQAKISHKFIVPLEADAVKNIVQLNNQSKHINKAFAEIEQLQQEIISDYRQTRDETIKNELPIMEARKMLQVISDHIVAFKQPQEANYGMDMLVDIERNAPNLTFSFDYVHRM